MDLKAYLDTQTKQLNILLNSCIWSAYQSHVLKQKFAIIVSLILVKRLII